LRVGSLDGRRTALAREKVEANLANVPGVILEDMQCGEGFCRANFSHESGERPDIRKLVGVPPFEGAGFTVEDADGSIWLYATESGMSLRDFQSDAKDAGPAERGFTTEGG
jgi:hypothetical protein